MTQVYNDFPPQGTFLTDEHRRVLGSLSHPLAVEGVVAWLARHDAKDTSKARTLKGAAEILADLEEHGLAVNLGDVEPDDPDARPKARAENVALQIVGAVADRDDVPTLHEEKAANYVERAQRDGIEPLPARENSGELWYWTKAGREKLMAPDPRPEHNEPMTGARLDAALEADDALHAQWEVDAAEARERQVQQLRDRADRIEAGEDV